MGRTRDLERYRPEDGWYHPKDRLPQIGQRIDCVWNGSRCCGDWKARSDGVPAFHYLSGSVCATEIERWRLYDGTIPNVLFFPDEIGVGTAMVGVAPLAVETEKPSRRKHNMSEENRRKAAERMKAMWASGKMQAVKARLTA